MVKTSSNITNPVETDSSVLKDIYDEYRPPKGIRYHLSQTEANLISNLTRINLKHTTVEYEPGLFNKHVEPPEPKKRYDKRKYKGPVWIFNEEKEEKKHLETQEIIRRVRQQKTMRLEKQEKQMDKQLQYAIKDSMGPCWYHEMSTLQMEGADALKQAMLKDCDVGTIQNTVDCLIQLGLVLLPNFTKVKYAFKKCYEYPVQFLLLLFKLTRPKDPKYANCYTLNDRIILSAVVHLSMRETLRELHLRTPSPPRPQTKCTRKKKKKRKISRKITCQSPYLKPTIFQPQYKNKWIFQRRQYAELEYFDYVEDMYEVTYEETIKDISGVSVGSSSTKYDKPPKIRIRLTEKLKTKRRLVTLKKPSSYECPCIMPKLDKIQKPIGKVSERSSSEIVAEEYLIPQKTESDHFCMCSPNDYNKKSQFELNIEVTTSDEILNLTQKLKPFDPENPVEELKLKAAVRIKTTGENKSREVELGIKHVEYSCECCICNKPINLYDSNNKISDQIKKCHSLSQSTLPIIKEFAEECGELFEGWAGEEGEEEINKCRCPSVESVKTDIFADLDDDYHSCTCKPKACSCCICEKPDPVFLLKLKRYNAINKTNYKPCVCACECKKNKDSRCSNKKKEKEEPSCKYCFCSTKPPVNKVYEDEKNLIAETKSKKKKTVIMGGTQLLKKKIKPKTLEELIYEEENALNALPDDMEDMEMEAKPERCACAKLYNKFLYSHFSCVELYKNYQNKMKVTMEQYLEKAANMCTCGDSYHELSHTVEGTDDKEKKKEETCECLQAVQDNQEKKREQNIEGCTCGEECISEESSLNYCRCSYPQIEEVLQEETISAISEKVDKEKPVEDNTNTSSNMPSKTETTEVIFISQAEKQEDDAKIFVLKKFPTNRKQQMTLLKQVLAAMAEDNYPLANLPDCHKLPHFQVWLDKRTRKYISWNERDELYKLSKKHWNFIQVLCPLESIPETGFSTNALQKITFAKVHKYQAMLNSKQTDYYRRLKQMHIKSGQQMFPPCFHYPLPTKTFRDVFFAYLPSDENHCHTIKPWEKHEYKDLRKRVPCVC